jgi:hypothetical protein
VADHQEQELTPFRPHELAARWGVNEQTITAALRAGRLQGFKLQKLWLIPRRVVERIESGEPA